MISPRQRTLLEARHHGRKPHNIFLNLSTFEQTIYGAYAKVDSMQLLINSELSIKKLARAEAELLAYIQSGACNPPAPKAACGGGAIRHG